MKYTGEYTESISFPLGGIGTGSIGLGGDGRLIDWEIFNRPSKGSINAYSNFAIRAIKGDEIICAVLNSDIKKEYMGQYMKSNACIGYGFGPNRHKMCGFPHFKDIDFNGEFPIASLDFKDDKFPAKVNMVAFNPFIPHDAKNSSIPAAFFEFEIENTTSDEITYQIAFSVGNPYEKSINKAGNKDGFKTLTLFNDGDSGDDVGYGDMTIATDCDRAYTQSYWYRGAWQDGVVSFWNDFSTKKDINERIYNTSGGFDMGSLFAEVRLNPKEKKKVRFILSWNVPNNYNYWDSKMKDNPDNKWKNYYATVFENSLESAVYSLENWDDLYNRTLKFKNSLHTSTLPKEIIDAASSNLSVLKSPTVLRLEDGSFYGWEGVHELEGSCEGTCQHVWNYAYALCFLFPELERSVRNTEFKYSTDEDGRMGFRTLLPLGRGMTDFRACLDGQMGTVIKCYREWKVSGDNIWLSENWENIKKVLEYAWSDKNPDAWDRDKDGVLEGRQHHTLDMELFGPSSWLEGMYLAALKAASEMAEFLHDDAKAEEYRELYEKGYEWTKNNLFNGKYFVQKVDVSDKSITDKFNASEEYWNDEVKQIKYQIADGSSIDQLLAQWHADIIGLGDIFDKSQVNTAMPEMMKNNYKESMRDFVNPWRIFSVNDEAGSIICSYPEDTQKPKIPIAYCEETMTGFEYSFAGLLLSRGYYNDGLKVVKAVRDRFDGKKRNPWNEFECGSNYARSMASYALIPILSGFEFDMPKGHIGFKPYTDGEFSAIWSVGNAWGIVEINDAGIKMTVLEGTLKLKSFGTAISDRVSSLKIDEKDVDFDIQKGKIVFRETKISDSLEIII